MSTQTANTESNYLFVTSTSNGSTAIASNGGLVVATASVTDPNEPYYHSSHQHLQQYQQTIHRKTTPNEF